MNVSGLLVVALVAAAYSFDGPEPEQNTASSQESAEGLRATVDKPRVAIPAAEPTPRKGAAESAALTDERAAAKGSIVQAASQAGINADAAILRDFQERINKYGEIHKDAAKGTAKPKESADPAKIISTQDALAARIRAARPAATQGDIFTAEIRSSFRRLLAPQLKGEDGRDAKALMKDDAPAPGSIPFKVNAKYPEGAPVPTVPASLLLSLPTLPRPLEYRFVGKHLLLLDTQGESMNYSDEAQLREKWGDKPCNHPEIEAEVEAGHPSINYVCTTCGKVGEGNTWNKPTEPEDSN